MEWIKASERLPEVPNSYCCRISGGYTTLFLRRRKNDVLRFEDSGGFVVKKDLIEWLDESALQTNVGGWIDVKDAPLYTTDEKQNWTCTEAGDKPFIAAIQYSDKRQQGKTLWWVMPCVVEDGIGLCVIGDDENTPAGWELSQVEFYKPLDLTPPINNKNK